MAKLLIASHIIPWSQDRTNRLNPRNGICLNALHDKAFDSGLITIEDDWRVKVSPKITKLISEGNQIELIQNYHNKKIRLPSRFRPDKSFLQFHRKNIFVNN